MHRYSESYHNTSIVRDTLPTKFTHYVFQLREGDLLCWENAKMYKKEDSIEMKDETYMFVLCKLRMALFVG